MARIDGRLQQGQEPALREEVRPRRRGRVVLSQRTEEAVRVEAVRVAAHAMDASQGRSDLSPLARSALDRFQRLQDEERPALHGHDADRLGDQDAGCRRQSLQAGEFGRELLSGVRRLAVLEEDGERAARHDRAAVAGEFRQIRLALDPPRTAFMAGDGFFDRGPKRDMEPRDRSASNSRYAGRVLECHGQWRMVPDAAPVRYPDFPQWPLPVNVGHTELHL